ncbi:muts domain V-domain-containing protein [Lentinula guzmanii]|uniref:DNA mismatch repair protein n=1 Tax=Lentinula guzmanii TaxID=2804957 RepID=A0AA38J520_9AGAR|nr:muts domain V-domain-containing protein [Lentinula guzmanii]
MASKSKSSENLKQKSLMSFFGKPQQSDVSSKPYKKSPTEKKLTTKDASRVASSDNLLQTPATRKPDLRAFNSSAAASSSSYSSSIKDTPPTSDAIDVDMMSSEESDRSKPRLATKRRRVVDDSDEDIQASGTSSHSRPSSSLPPSSPSERLSRIKKARYSEVLTDEDEDEEVASSFTQRITKFKKSPAKKGRRSSRASEDDDDFIVPSEESDVEVESTKTSSSRPSSRQSLLSDEDEDEDDVVSKKSKPKPKTKLNAKVKTSTQDSDSFSFLTAAERREQDKKDEKKAAETPYGFLQDVKDKDGRRPGDSKYDPRTLYVPTKAWKEFTPFEKQFWEIKQNHYDTILFFQKGKFFELYEDDARIGHQEFDLKLTQRVKMSMVGVPEMSFNFWAAKFLGKGYKVGKVEQSETALGAEMRLAGDKKSGKPKGGEKEKIVRRELNKVYTNGTLVDGEMIIDDEAGHCISIREIESDDGSHNTFGICVLDCSTSQFDLAIFEDDICRTKLETMIRQIRPKEMLFTKGNLSVSTTRLLKSILPAACLWTGLREVEGLGYKDTLEDLKVRFPVTDELGDTDDGELLPESVPKPIRDMVDSEPAIEALGLLIWYLQQLNIDKDIISMKNFNIYDPMKQGEGLVLDGQTLAHIEREQVVLNNEGTEEGSLLKLLGRCITPFGKRLFRIWLCMPLREIAAINARLDAVQDLMDHPTFESAFTEAAKGLPDLERVVSRIHARNCKVKDFLKVLNAFKKLSRAFTDLANASESFKSKTVLGLLRSAPDLIKHIKNIESLFEKPSSDKGDELVPRDGKDEAYDEVMAEIQELEQGLDSALEKFEKTLGVKLNWWHSAVGSKEIYMVETTAGQKNIPKDWIKNSGTKAKTRWLVPPLQKSIRSLKEAREKRNTAIKEFKYRLFAEFDEDRAVWLRATRVFAELDCLFSLAKSSTAIGEPACRPEFVPDDSAWFDFKSLRHPTLCASTSVDNFIPNDVKLGGDVGKIALLTGPNMAGKSTVMRMTATGIIMAQLGMFVPAESARLSPVNSILTRMGAYDNMFSNSSTFKVELDECCKILRDATPKSFVILDELGRGTSTYDGMAIAGAVLHELATHTLPLSFFATHYGSLTDDFAYHPNIRNMYMSTIVDDEKRAIVFLYKLIEGVATSSFGTHVANLAGVPMEVVERADVISKSFAEQFKAKLQEKQKKRASGRLPLVAQADFAYLIQLATGKVQLPDDQTRRKVVLSMMKKVAQTYVAFST